MKLQNIKHETQGDSAHCGKSEGQKNTIPGVTSAFSVLNTVLHILVFPIHWKHVKCSEHQLFSVLLIQRLIWPMESQEFALSCNNLANSSNLLL